MNTLGWLLAWTGLQVSVFCTAGIGLYLVARRRNPAAGAWAAGAVLMVTIGISALSLSPWPRWWTVGVEDPRPLSAIEPSPARELLPNTPASDALDLGAIGEGLVKRNRPGADASRDAATPPAAGRSWSQLWSNLRGSLKPLNFSAPDRAWHWPAWLAVVILVGCSVALVRLLVAVAAVGGYRALTREVSDPALLEVLDHVRARLGCARRLELRETSALCSPSTVGWLRPIVILPGDWRSWSLDERRAVLAHEVAHVARGDFGLWLVAQLGVALHFYNPLVHWLAGRLRLEQELAADLFGAHLGGGRQQYLTTLAQMALRQSGPQVLWAARPFLPTRRTLMTRIEMLHHQKILPSLTLSYAARACLALAIVVAGWLVAGVRGPATAAPPETTTKVNIDTTPINLDFVTKDAELVVALRPAELAKLKSLEPIKTALDKSGLFDPLGLTLEDIEEFKMVASPLSRDPNSKAVNPSWRLIVFRSQEPRDWSKLALSITGKNEKTSVGGQEYYQSTLGSGGSFSAYWLPDDRTIVFSSIADIGRTFSLRDPANQPTWADQWKKVAEGPAAMMLGTVGLQEIADNVPRPAAATPRVDVAPHVDVALFKGAEVSGAFQVTGTFECRNSQSAQEINNLIQQRLDAVKKDFAEAGKPSGSPAAALAASSMGQIMLKLVEATKVEVKDSTVRTQTAMSAELGAIIGKTFAPARAEANRNYSENKLKQIGVALLNYHETYKRFPSAVVMGPDGKTPHSWRVELLPFLDAEKVYKRYKMDQPWDSEENLKLVKEGAELFSVPSEPQSDDCGYFVLTGPGTVFDPSAPPSAIRTIIDGTHWTIGVVEARRSIPWTKPEDIEYSPDKPLPKLGGHFEGGFEAMYMDASVRRLPNDLDEATLRALISKNGREVTRESPDGRPKVGN
jgi:beta-lactamase regulating signal transducer with metallopeptidase domain